MLRLGLRPDDGDGMGATRVLVDGRLGNFTIEDDDKEGRKEKQRWRKLAQA